MHLSDLFFWRHKDKGHVIKKECYDSLPETHRTYYEQTKKSPTHVVERSRRSDDDLDDILLTALTTAAIVDILDGDNSSSVSHDMGGSYDSTPDTDFQGFGGGDTGGGGAGGDWSDDSSDSSFDSDSSSFDSGSDSSW